MIEVNNLVKRFDATLAVNGISFEVKKGEVVGFLGPNGAGKTTTLRILTCYLPADAGSATIAGYNVFEDSIEVRKRVGYLPENAPLYLDMGVVDYLKFIARIRHVPKKNIIGRIKEMVDICGLGTEINKNISELSKGFRQRVGLAQTLIHDPDILILDEPTVGLDPNQIVEIRELIKDIGKEKTVILSSHILPEVSATCDRIIIINKGKIVGSGSPEEMASQARGEEIIYITVRGPLPEILEKFKTLSEIKDFEKISEDNGANRFQITCASGVDLSEDLFCLAKDNGWILRELKKEAASLEDIFYKLTT